MRSFAYNILKHNQTDTVPQDRLAAAFGGIKSMPPNEIQWRALNSPADPSIGYYHFDEVNG